MPKSLLVLAALSAALVITSAASAAPVDTRTSHVPRPIAASCTGDECTAKYGERSAVTTQKRRDAQRAHRYFAKKQLCRQYDVRFDRSGLCW